MIQASAPGKVILTGEHSVVYGHSAIAIAVRSMRVSVDLLTTDGPSGLCKEQLNIDERLAFALHQVLPPYGIKVRFKSDLPIGAGMGSSAALSIATLRALEKWELAQGGSKWTRAQFLKLAHKMESVFHGNPSGLDHTVSLLEQAIFFKKVQNNISLTPISTPNLSLIIMDSHEVGNTATQVAKVSQNWPNNRNLINQIGKLSEHIYDALILNDLKRLGTLMTQNHDLLVKLNVSTPKLDQVVDTALSNGALGAKLAGSGGGGIALALLDTEQAPAAHSNSTPSGAEKIMSAIDDLGYKSFVVHLNHQVQ